MKLYSRMNANLAMAWAGGGAFLAIQVALALVFRTRPTSAQWLGYALIAMGMGLASFAVRGSPGAL